MACHLIRPLSKIYNYYMKKKHLLVLVSFMFLVSCSESNEETTSSRIINAVFSSYSVGITSTVDLPAFPFEDVVEKTDYSMQAFSTAGTLIGEWNQDISEGFTFEASGFVKFQINKEASYEIPRATYSLEGEESVHESQTSVTISLENKSYAGIAIYSDFISTVSINGEDDLAEIEVAGGSYLYSFVEPSRHYNIIIQDVQNNVHRVDIQAQDIDVNEMLRLYISINDISGEFEIIYDWEYEDIPLN